MPSETDIKPTEAMEGLEAVRGRAEAVDKDEIKTPNVNLVGATVKGLGMARQVDKDAAAFDEQLPTVSREVRDGIGTLSLAVWAGNHLYLNSLENPEKAASELKKMFEQAGIWREKLFAAARFIWGDKPEVMAILERIRKGQGYRDRADDVAALSLLFQDRWSEADGETSLTLEKVKEVGEMGAQFLKALGFPADADANAGEPGSDVGPRELRDRVWTIFFNDYNELQAAGRYLHRNDDDAAKLYPSLFERDPTS